MEEHRRLQAENSEHEIITLQDIGKQMEDLQETIQHPVQKAFASLSLCQEFVLLGRTLTQLWIFPPKRQYKITIKLSHKFYTYAMETLTKKGSSSKSNQFSW